LLVSKLLILEQKPLLEAQKVKITRKNLKKMILSELSGMVASVDDPRRHQSDFFFSHFDNDTAAAHKSLKNLGDMARDDEQLKPEDLQYLKDNHIEQLYDALGFLEATIDARLGGNRGYKD
tara:strand:+ start:116 stop:478 length:363 start_codon:yes stop_codon:yes gene_type:complete